MEEIIKKTNLFDKCISWIISHRILLILICIYITFFDFINLKYHVYIVTPILTEVSQNYLVDIIFIFITVLILFYIIQKFKMDYYIKPKYALYSLVILGFYSYFRFTHTNFLSFKLCDSFKYFDSIFLIFLFPILIYGNYYFFNKKQLKEQISDLYLDEAIKKADEDILGRINKVNNTVKDIQNTNLSSSIAFGIVGKWGDGKTSYMNLIKEKIKNNKEYIIIEFSAWLNISTKSIIQDFFDTVEAALKGQSLNLAKEIRKYGNSVLKNTKNQFLMNIFYGMDFLSENSLSSEFKNTNEQLNKLNKKVVVFLDDLDRLSPNEIFEVLKLIRNTASFDSFIYVVGYDKEYLVSSLKEKGIPNSTKYCEKIFLKEYFLLPLTKEQINDYLKTALLKFFSESKKKDEINSFFEDRNFVYNYSIEEITFSIQNIRDAKRFLNEFIPIYKIIQEEVLFRDYYNIKLLKFSFYEVYNLLYEDKKTYIEGRSKKITKLTLTKKELSNGFSRDVFTNSKIEDFIINELKYDKNKLIKIKTLLNNLFNDYYKNIPLSITDDQNYYKYFKDELGKNDLSYNEYKNALKLPIDELKKNIDNWNREGKIRSAQYYIYYTNVLSFENKGEYEKYVNILFYIANIQNDESSISRIVGLDNDYLLGCINNYQNKIVPKYYNNNKSKLREFIQSIFNNASSPYDYELEILQHIQNYDDENILTKSEIESYLIDYFEKYSKGMVSVPPYFWNYFWKYRIKENDKNFFPPKIKSMFKELLPKFLDDFLVLYVNIEKYDDYKAKISIRRICAIFDSIENFIEYISSKLFKESLTKKPEFLDEFLNFYEEWSNAQNSNPQGVVFILYDFKYLPIVEKIKNL